MRKQTDLAKVKQTARSLLFTDIHETEFSPVIVSHPFTDSGFVASPNADGEIGLLNITESDADQRRWREYMGKLIDGAKSAYEIYMMITKPYGLTFLKYTAQDLSREDMSQILASAWTRSEAPHQDVNVTVNQLLRMFKQADPTCLMEQDEYMDAASFGQNAYFYDAAEGLLTATILLVAEFCEPEKRHIVSVFKIIQELLAPSQKKGKNQFQQLMEMLPDDHKAKWFAGAALNTAEQSMASVMSTALSRLNSFLDSELEQLLCFDTEIDAEKFCNEKSAIFVVMPEENPNTFFMISLIIQQLYREILAVADEHGGKLKNRCVFFCDEFGTLPKIESAEMMFSASRSRRLQIVPIIQSFSQLDKNYGKEGAEIIVDNTQLTIFGGFAPNSSSAEVLSKALGSRTVMSGSVSRSRNDPSESLQMIERPLLTPDELKSLPKGQFVVMKTGVHPMRVKLKLFFKWGIEFDEDNPYAVPDHGGREVQYAEKKEIMDGIIKKYHPDWIVKDKPATDGGNGISGQDQAESENHEPQQTPPKKPGDKKGGGGMNPVPPNRRTGLKPAQEVKPNEPS